MDDYWQALAGNLAVVALFISAWLHGQFLLAERSPIFRSVVFGVVMGLGAFSSMLMAIQVMPGVIFDVRNAMIAVAAFFGGPIAALAAAAIGIAGRSLVLGGPGAIPGAASMVVSALVGLALWASSPRWLPQWLAVVALAVLTGLNTSLVLVFVSFGWVEAPPISGQVGFVTGFATLVCALFIIRHQLVERERDLLRAAFLQAPDFQYVKAQDGKFAAANLAVAQYLGHAAPRELIGKTLFEVIDADQAEVIETEEQAILAGGDAVHDHEEAVSVVGGEQKWFRSSKVALRGLHGEIIGLVSATRDISASRALERETTEARNRLDYVLSGVSDGIAMFDAAGLLVYANPQYADLFPLTREVRQIGRTLRDILDDIIAKGEQVVPKGREQEWIDTTVEMLKTGGEEEVELFNGHWLHVRTKPTPEGAALIVVSDVTAIKKTEATLREMTGQLRLLATTDGLTGLTNRRAFDASLESELSRGRRDARPLSLLLIDVDRFKPYNDIYGHPAGDEVLRKIGATLKEALRRPADVAARYGGEEFVAVLPDTDEEGALFIADAFREKVRALAEPHRGGDSGIVTVSVGLATVSQTDLPIITATELVRRADEALYRAKDDGRNRIVSWRAQSHVNSPDVGRFVTA